MISTKKQLNALASIDKVIEQEKKTMTIEREKSATDIDERDRIMEGKIRALVTEEIEQIKTSKPRKEPKEKRKRPIIQRIREVVIAKPRTEVVVVRNTPFVDPHEVIDNPPPVIRQYYPEVDPEPKETEDYTETFNKPLRLVDPAPLHPSLQGYSSSAIGSMPSGVEPSEEEEEPCDDGDCGCLDCDEKARKKKRKKIMLIGVGITLVVGIIIYRITKK